MNARIRSLDGIRGIAILLVLAGHAAANYQPLSPAWRHWLEAFANPGAGVRLFFVLSGYLITHLLLKEFAATGTISIRHFYQRRALRIFAAFYAYLTVVVLVSLWRPMGLNWDTAFAAATFTWNYQALWATPPAEGIWPLGHLWTLALEQQFYLLWPLVLVLARPRRALWIAVALVIWCPFARVGSYYLFPAQRGLLGMMLHTGIDSLMAGCAAALLMESRDWRARLQAHGRPAVAISVAWLVLASPLLSQLIRGFAVAAGFTVDAIAAAALIAWVHRAATPAAEKGLGRGVLPLLGVISYSLYLWQQLFFSPTGWLADSRLALPLLVAVVAAGASYRFIERPFLQRKARVAVLPPPVAAEPQT